MIKNQMKIVGGFFMNYFLIPHEDGTWDVRKEGTNRDSYSGLSSLSAAKNAARGLGGVRVAVKGLDGRIEYWEDL